MELMIVMALMSVLMTALYYLVSRGLEFYRDSVAVMEIRQSALVGVARLDEDLRATAQESVRWDDGSGGAVGLVLPSVRDLGNQMRVHHDGKLIWSTFVGYYVEPVNGVSALVRRQESIGYDEFRAPDPLAQSPARSPLYFRDTSTGPKQLICSQLRTFEATIGTDIVEYRMEFELATRYNHLIEIRSKSFPRM